MLLLFLLLCLCVAAAPKGRLQYLQQPSTPWTQLLVYEVGQQGAMHGPFLCSSSSNISSSGGTSSSSSQADESAPADVPGQLQEALQLPLLGYSHMVYVCYKP